MKKKLNDSNIVTIYRLIKEGKPAEQICEMVGINKSTLYSILQGLRKRGVDVKMSRNRYNWEQILSEIRGIDNEKN